jgi:hypothetical protein
MASMMKQRLPSHASFPSTRCLSRCRVYPTGQSGEWLVVGTKRDTRVTAHSFFQLLDEVRKARRASR